MKMWRCKKGESEKISQTVYATIMKAPANTQHISTCKHVHAWMCGRLEKVSEVRRACVGVCSRLL